MNKTYIKYTIKKINKAKPWDIAIRSHLKNIHGPITNRKEDRGFHTHSQSHSEQVADVRCVTGRRKHLGIGLRQNPRCLEESDPLVKAPTGEASRLSASARE